MKFDTKTALFLDEALKNVGIDRNYSILSSSFSYFNKNELDKIVYLVITNLDDISFLPYLKNLRGLVITSADYNQVTLDGDYNNNILFNNIKDFSYLEQLENLESLEINNDINIHSLDLSKLKKLQRLILINNPLLTEIKGSGNLHYLLDVEMSGNPIRKFEDFTKFLGNTLDARRNIIDIDSYLAGVLSPKMAKDIYDKALIGIYNQDIKFSERSGFTNFNTINLKELTDLYRNLNRKLKSNGLMEMNIEEKINYLYNYGYNMPFAMNEIIKRDKEYRKILAEYNGKVPFFFQQSMNYLHSSYTTYQLKKGNCEGIVNLMHIMASIIGIESQTIYCHVKKSDNVTSNHALIRFKINNCWSYFDPTYDRNDYQKYTYMTLEQVQEYADLPKIENIIIERDNGYGKNNARCLKKNRN